MKRRPMLALGVVLLVLGMPFAGMGFLLNMRDPAPNTPPLVGLDYYLPTILLLGGMLFESVGLFLIVRAELGKSSGPEPRNH